MEIMEASRSDIEIAGLRQETEKTKERTANVESTNLVLRAKVAELELRLEPRRITMEQVRKFVFLTERIEKIPIKILINTAQEEQVTLASDLREMFTYAGFKTNSDANAGGITSDMHFVIHKKFGTPINRPDLLFVTYSPTNQDFIDMPPVEWAEITNGISRPIFITTSNQAYSAIADCLEQIGVTVGWTCGPERRDECSFFVVPK